MSKYNYVIYEGLLISIIWIFIMIYLISEYNHNIVFLLIGALSTVYAIMKLELSIKLLIDKINGIKKTETVFMGILNKEQLEIFRKIIYYNIYFDDTNMPKNYMAFCHFDQINIRQGDAITISYYPLSRIVVYLAVNERSK